MNNLNNIPGEIIKTSQLPEDMPTHLVGVILGTSPKTVKYSTTLFASQIASQMTDVVRTSFVYSDPTWLGTLHWNKIINTPSTILGYGITDAVSSSRTLSINGTTYDLSANRSWTVGDVLSSGSYVNPSWITSLAWTKITGAPSFITTAITSLNGLTGTTQTFVNDTNVTMVSTGTTHTLTWSGTLADSRIASATNWNTAYTNRITSLTTTGSSGAATLVSNVLNIPTYSLSGLGGQPLATNLTSISALTYASTSFVKMTAAGTFALDTNTYLTAESDTLASVTGRGATTTTAVTMGKLTTTGAVSGVGNASSYTVTAASGSAISKQITSTLIASANGDVLVGLDINPTFTVGSFTGVTSRTLRVAGNIGLVGTPIFFGTATFNDGVFFSSQVVAYAFRSNSSIDFTFRKNDNTIFATFFNSTGNVTLQNGGTFTDAGFRLDVNGTARIQNQLTTTGSITAASAIARGVYMNNTLVAAANNDVLVGLDIAPTFTNGAFTGVVNYGIRNSSKTTLGDILSITGGGSTPVGLGNGLHLNFSSNIGWIQSLQTGVLGRQLNIMGNPIFMGNSNSGVLFFNLTTSGNLILQNGGTFTDAGFRLDVVGADSRFNGIRAGLGAGQVASNTVFGNGALGSNGTGSAITAIGYQALNANTTAVDNTAFGYQAGFGITTGSYNTIIGNRISSSIAGASNCVLGTQINGTGSSNTIMGSFASTGGFNSSVILGRQATATANNQFVVGSSTVNAGAVATASVTQTKTWDVIINGVAQKILLA